MADAQDNLAPNFFTPDEQEAVEFANNLYGAVAKTQAGEFVARLGLDSDVAEQVMGAISLKLDGLPDFRDKELAGKEFEGLSQKFGEQPVAQAVLLQVPTPVESTPVDNSGTTNIASANSGSSAGEVQGSAAARPEGNPILEGEELGVYARRHFISIFGEHQTDIITALSLQDGFELAQLVGALYKELPLRRLSPEDRQKRVDIFLGFMMGEGQQELGNTHGMSRQNVHITLGRFAEQFTELTKPEQRDALLAPLRQQYELGNPPEPEQGTPAGPLTDLQKKYVSVIVGPELLQVVDDMTDEQRAQFAELIGNYYVTIENEEIAERQKVQNAKYAKAFIKGGTIGEIADYEDDHKESVETGLKQVLDTISGVIAPAQLIKLVLGDSFDFADQDKATRRIDEAIRERNGKFLRGLYGEGLTATIINLDQTQVDLLAQELVEFYRGVPLAKVGPSAQEQRAQQFVECLQGKSYQDVAATHGVRADEVRENLSSVRSTLKEKVDESDLLTILELVADSGEESSANN